MAARTMTVDREKLIDTIHALQTDLLMLTDWLARDAEPLLAEYSVVRLIDCHYALHSLIPSVRRH